MYLVHYPVVVWLQFALLAFAPGPIAKGSMVFAGAVALSWGMVAALRRIPLMARLLLIYAGNFGVLSASVVKPGPAICC